MTYPTAIKNITAGKLVRALRRDGFVPRRAHGSLIFVHPDGRMVPVHYHHSGQVFPPGTLRRMLAQARWTTDYLVPCCGPPAPPRVGEGLGERSP